MFGAMVQQEKVVVAPETNASASGDTCDKVVKVNASQSASHAAIGDTGDKVALPPTRHANAPRSATPKADDVVATTPNMPRAWSDTFLTGVSAGNA